MRDGSYKKANELINEESLMPLSYNHKVIKTEKTNIVSDVYCLEVKEFHNFALTSGVFVHNCTSFGISGAMEFDENNEGINFVPLSQLFIYYNERSIEGTVDEDSGAQIRDGIKAVSSKGACAESLWPYDITKFTMLPPPDAYEDGLSRDITQYLRLNDFDDIQQCLANGFPAVIGFNVYESFEDPQVAETGIMPIPDYDNEECLGGHCVLVCGYDIATQMLLVKNSWGTGWGLPSHPGFFSMPFEFAQSSEISDMWVIKK